MLSSFSSLSISLFTPLEQFDNVSWLSSHVRETFAGYGLSLFGREFDAATLAAGTPSADYLFTGRLGSGIRRELVLGALLFTLFLARRNSLPAALSPIASAARPAVSATFLLLAAISLLSNGPVALWFTDLLLPTVGIAGSALPAFSFAPQIEFSFAIDERRVSLILAFFLLGGGEEEEEDDFLLSDGGDLSAVEEVVAPLFISNLGLSIRENGALYRKACALFAFVLANNLRGRLPYSDTATSSLGLTFWVALATFGSLLALRLQKHGISYLFSLFRPSGTPLPLLLLLIPIEAISYTFRLVSLSVRLFANRRAGHTLRKVLIGFSYVFLTLGDLYALAAFLPGLVVFLLVFLERGVAAIQAYIFVTLSLIYRKDIYVGH